MARLTLNAAARRLDRFAQAQKIRAHIGDGELLIRPTNRVSDMNLDGASEQLVPLTGGKFRLVITGTPAGSYSLEAGKYGWFKLIPGHEGSAPAVKLA